MPDTSLQANQTSAGSAFTNNREVVDEKVCPTQHLQLLVFVVSHLNKPNVEVSGHVRSYKQL